MRSWVVGSLALTGCLSAADHTPAGDDGLAPSLSAPSGTFDGGLAGGSTTGPAGLRWSDPTDPDTQSTLQAAPGLRTWLPVYGTPTEGGEHILHQDVQWIADTLGNQLVGIVADGTSRIVPLGGEPVRVLAIGDALFVTLRASGEVVRVRVSDAPRVLDRVHVGAEPYDIAASSDGKVLYVALSQEDAVIALSSESLEEIGRWRVSGEPKWLAVDRFEQVAVGTARASRIRVIDPWRGTVRTVPLPEVVRPPDCEATTTRPLHARITGDLLFSQQNFTLLVPTLYADTQLFELPVPVAAMFFPPGFDTNGPDTGFEPDMPHTGTPRPGGSDPCDATPRPGGGGGPYGKPVDPTTPAALGRFNPMLVELDLAGGSHVHALGSIAGRGRVIRSYPSAVAETLGFVGTTHPGDGAFLLFPLGTFIPSTTPSPVRANAAEVPVGARSVAMYPDVVTAWAWSFLSRDTALIDASATVVGFQAAPVLDGVDLGAMRMFYSAANPAMSAAGAGVSCETCHSDGRNDGLTWQFEDMPRQTPSLAFNPDETAPLTWLGDVASVEDEIHATTQNRMNGTGLTAAEARSLAAVVRQIRTPIRPTYDAASVARGRAVFERADVGCAGCHGGSTFADGRTVKVLDFDTPTNTPSLRGVGSTAPYLHDGSAATLGDVLDRAADGKMGATSHLTPRERDDLLTYLMSL